MTISGLIERVTYHNEETGYCVLRVKSKEHRDLVTVVGNVPSVNAGEWITADGAWVQDRDHGMQLKAEFIQCSEPSSDEGIEKYLGSGLIKGIGPVYAKKLVGKFGGEVLKLLINIPPAWRKFAASVVSVASSSNQLGLSKRLCAKLWSFFTRMA